MPTITILLWDQWYHVTSWWVRQSHILICDGYLILNVNQASSEWLKFPIKNPKIHLRIVALLPCTPQCCYRWTLQRPSQPLGPSGTFWVGGFWGFIFAFFFFDRLVSSLLWLSFILPSVFNAADLGPSRQFMCDHGAIFIITLWDCWTQYAFSSVSLSLGLGAWQVWAMILWLL